MDIDGATIDFSHIAPNAVEYLRAKTRGRAVLALTPAHAGIRAVENDVAHHQEFGRCSGRLRRSKPRTRAINSATEKGLTT